MLKKTAETTMQNDTQPQSAVPDESPEQGNSAQFPAAATPADAQQPAVVVNGQPVRPTAGPVPSGGVPQAPLSPKKSGIKRALMVIGSILMAVLVICGVGLFAFVAYIFHTADSLCGSHSSAHKAEVSKVAIFNSVSVLPDQPNKPASIYDSSEGTCNIDVEQSYSATKSYAVSMVATAAVATVTDNLKKQGFTLGQQVFSKDGCAHVWDEANYRGRSITITVAFGSPTKDCPGPDVNSYDPTITQELFTGTTVTSIQATVSTPDRG